MEVVRTMDCLEGILVQVPLGGQRSWDARAGEVEQGKPDAYGVAVSAMTHVMLGIKGVALTGL
jgi:hypothetical protein